MNLAEVIRENKQRHSRLEIIPLAAEGVRQSRQSAHTHSDGEVYTFNVAGADQTGFGIADPRLNYSLCNLAGE